MPTRNKIFFQRPLPTCTELSPGWGNPLWKKGFQLDVLLMSKEILAGCSLGWMLAQICNENCLNKTVYTQIYPRVPLTYWGRDKMAEIFKWVFLDENVWISNKISSKFVLWGPINNIPALVQIMAWRRPGNKPLSEPVMVISMTQICVTRPQWVNSLWQSDG